MRAPVLTATTLASLALACVPRPSEGECDAMVDHIIQLTRDSHDGRAAEIAQAVSEEHREALRERCIQDGTAREVACVLGATSLEAIHECAPER